MTIISFIITLIAAVSLGIFLKQYTLPIVLTYQNWSLEMPLWLLVLSALLCLGTFVALYHFMLKLWFNFNLAKIKFNIWRKKQGEEKLQLAILKLTEGHYRLAEKTALRAAKLCQAPFLCWLIAAQAAHSQNAWLRRDTYLQSAIAANPKSELAINLIKAKFQLQDNHLTDAMTTITAIQTKASKNPQLLAIKSAIYQQNSDWKGLIEIMPLLKKYAPDKDDCLATLEIKAYSSLLVAKAKDFNQQQLTNTWQKSIPKQLKKNPSLLANYLQCLLLVNANNLAENLARKTLATAYNDKIIELYGKIYSGNLSKQISFAESFLSQHPANQHLLLALARLTIKNKLWGKARDYLETCIANSPTAESYAELAKLLEQLGEKQQSSLLYKQGLLTLTKTANSTKLIEQ